MIVGELPKIQCMHHNNNVGLTVAIQFGGGGGGGGARPTDLNFGGGGVIAPLPPCFASPDLSQFIH